MTEWEDLFEMSKRWPDIRKPKEHILDTETKHKIGSVRGEFMHWFVDMERIGDDMNDKLKAIKDLYGIYVTLPVFRLDLVTFKEFLDKLNEILNQSSTPSKTGEKE